MLPGFGVALGSFFFLSPKIGGLGVEKQPWRCRPEPGGSPEVDIAHPCILVMVVGWLTTWQTGPTRGKRDPVS
jgi:hypothetical protein